VKGRSDHIFKFQKFFFKVFYFFFIISFIIISFFFFFFLPSLLLLFLFLFLNNSFNRFYLKGEAIYEIGVDDDGSVRGLSESDLEASLKTLREMAKELSAEISVLCERKGKCGLALQVLVREMRELDKIVDIRIAVCGNVDSGKSTMIGVLITGENDNGRGAARLNVFAHKHEIESGRTSSISEQMLGFDSKGKIVNYRTDFHSPSWADIANESCKIISFFDLAGHEKYLKTTISGMTGHLPG
jgi:GTPase